MRCALLISCLVLFCACTPRGPQPEAVKPNMVLDSTALGEDARIRARQFYEGDQLDFALFWYTHATQYNPQDKHAWHGKAATLGRLGRHQEALGAFEEALRIDSNYVGAIWHRACGFAAQLEKDKALTDLRRAIAIDSTIKSAAQQDSCFWWMWQDEDFLALVN